MVRQCGIMGYWAISDSMILVKMRGQPFKLSIIQIYAPTSEYAGEEMEADDNDHG